MAFRIFVDFESDGQQRIVQGIAKESCKIFLDGAEMLRHTFVVDGNFHDEIVHDLWFQHL